MVLATPTIQTASKWRMASSLERARKFRAFLDGRSSRSLLIRRTRHATRYALRGALRWRSAGYRRCRAQASLSPLWTGAHPKPSGVWRACPQGCQR
jgi:hypothetical protein